jgi:hypothetical protein
LRVDGGAQRRRDLVVKPLVADFDSKAAAGLKRGGAIAASLDVLFDPTRVKQDRIEAMSSAITCRRARRL